MKRQLIAALFLIVFHSRLVAEERPNVLFLIADDLTAEALACYGNKQVKTPNIDKLAKRGVLFERAYCQYPVCGPARAAIMSGRYPQAVGVTGNGSAGSFTKEMKGRASMSEHLDPLHP